MKGSKAGSHSEVSRRTALRAGLSAGAALAVPTIIPSSALGLDGAVPPSERIIVGGIGISGAPGGAEDDACARAGIAAIEDRLLM
jgi:uncharacterized protein GlcG (DUF336 family)